MHNGSNNDYHFIIKEPAKEFEGEFNYLEENTKKYNTLSLWIIKVKRVDKNTHTHTHTHHKTYLTNYNLAIAVRDCFVIIGSLCNTRPTL